MILSPKLLPPAPARSIDGLGGLATFEERLGEYLHWNQREQGALIADRGKKVSIAIYKIYRKQAEPNKAALRQKIFAQEGYAIKRRLRRDSSGKHISWADEVNLRASGVSVLATSWLHSRWRSNQAQGRHLRTNRRRRIIGSADIAAGPDNPNPSVRLTSYLAGAVALNQERALISQALYYQAADMAVYIERKHREFIASRLVGDFRSVIEV